MTSRRRPLEPRSVTRYEQEQRKKRSLKVSKNDTLRKQNRTNAENTGANLRKPSHVPMRVYRELYDKAEALLIALNAMRQCCDKAGADFPFKDHQALWRFMYADYKA